VGGLAQTPTGEGGNQKVWEKYRDIVAFNQKDQNKEECFSRRTQKNSCRMKVDGLVHRSPKEKGFVRQGLMTWAFRVGAQKEEGKGEGKKKGTGEEEGCLIKPTKRLELKIGRSSRGNNADSAAAA